MAETPPLCPTCKHVAASCAPLAWDCEDRFHFIPMPASPGWLERFQSAGKAAFAGVPSEGTCDCGQVRVEYDGCELRFRAPEDIPDPSQAPMEYYFDWNPSAWPTPDRNYP